MNLNIAKSLHFDVELRSTSESNGTGGFVSLFSGLELVVEFVMISLFYTESG